MGLEAKRRYRFEYLKSEEWRDLRTLKLCHAGAMCGVCGKKSFGNDVHHVRYRKKRSDTKLSDLLVACRECHTAIHTIWLSHPHLVPGGHGGGIWRKMGRVIKMVRDQLRAKYGSSFYCKRYRWKPRRPNPLANIPF